MSRQSKELSCHMTKKTTENDRHAICAANQPCATSGRTTRMTNTTETVKGTIIPHTMDTKIT